MGSVGRLLFLCCSKPAFALACLVASKGEVITVEDDDAEATHEEEDQDMPDVKQAKTPGVCVCGDWWFLDFGASGRGHVSPFHCLFLETSHVARFPFLSGIATPLFACVLVALSSF